MGRPGRSDRGNEKFVQWKEPVQSKGGTSNVDGPDNTSTVRKNRVTRRQKSLLTSLEATIQEAPAEVEFHDTINTAEETETGGGSIVPTPAQFHSSDPSPRFRPPRQIQNDITTPPCPTARVSVGASEFSAHVAGEATIRKKARERGVQRHSAVDQHEDEDNRVPKQRRPPEGEDSYRKKMN